MADEPGQDLWVPITEFPDYEINVLGDIRTISQKRLVHHTFETLLGYARVKLWNRMGRYETMSVDYLLRVAKEVTHLSGATPIVEEMPNVAKPPSNTIFRDALIVMRQKELEFGETSEDTKHLRNILTAWRERDNDQYTVSKELFNALEAADSAGLGYGD